MRIVFKKHSQINNNNYSEVINSYPIDFIENKQKIYDSDLIIVCDEDNPSNIVENLLLITCSNKVDLISTKFDLSLKYNNNKRVNFYNYIDAISNYEDFVEDNLNIDNAMNAYIYNIEKNNEECCWNDFISTWNSKSSFYRYDRICKEEFLQFMEDFSSIGKNKQKYTKSLIYELEHIRWCRYHYFFNWKHGVPKNEQEEDEVNKIHKMLVPYNQLGKCKKAHANVFICHTHNDITKANSIYNSLKYYDKLNYCISPFYGDSIKDQEGFEFIVFKVIDFCDVFINILSPQLLKKSKDNKDFISKQLHYCIKKNKKIINIAPNTDFSWPEDFPDTLAKIKNINPILLSDSASFIKHLLDSIDSLNN